jgi:predicted phage baseplate assembly protein
MGDVLHFYVDRAAGEASLKSATQRESVLALAALLDYIPNGRTPARATITIDASGSDATDSDPIILPDFWRFNGVAKNSGASEVVFTLDNAIAIVSSSSLTTYIDPATNESYPTVSKATPFTVTVTEGERYEELYTTTGLPSQQIVLENTGIVPESITVEVAEGIGGEYVSYSKVERLLEATSSQKSFLSQIDARDRTFIKFGNGVNGAVPIPNALIRVVYRRSRGAAGNLPPNSITEFDFTTLDDGRSLSSIVVTGNTSSSTGGGDSESIDSLKVNIPLSFRTQDRAVSLSDYKDLTLRVGGVSKAMARLNSGTVQIYAVSPQGDYSSRLSTQSTVALSTDLSEQIDEYLSPRSIVGVDYEVQSTVTLQKVRITLSRLQVLDGYIQEKVVTEVRSAIASLFTFDNVSFGMKVSLGTLYRTILSVSGVDFATISQLTTTDTVDQIDSAYSFQGVEAGEANLLYIATDILPTITAISGGIVGSTGV